MPQGSAKVRLDAVRYYGAEVTETEVNYDDTVVRVAELAKDNNWVVIQDTAWKGYEEIPLNIMQGYSTIISEIQEQLGNQNFEEITHVVLQAGVGSFAGAIAATLLSLRKDKSLKVIIVEPDKAACLFESAQDDEGRPVRVLGDLDTMMAGLACGEPNPFAWNLLKSIVSYYYSCDDVISAVGMRVLGNSIYDGKRIIAGESGSVPVGFIYSVLNDDNYKSIKEELDLNETSSVLTINTESDTDPDNYRRVVWDKEKI